ncbi:MAG: hypothetical protein ACR2NU_12350 [Aeoliella sp.]
MKTHKRKRLMVDPKLQIAVLCRVTMYWLVAVTVLCLMAAVQVVLTDSAVGYELLANRVMIAFGPALIASVIALPLLLFDCVRFTNKFAGPMHRLRREVKQLADTGKAEPMDFRKGDFWYDLAVQFNRLAERMQSDFPETASVPEADKLEAAPVA